MSKGKRDVKVPDPGKKSSVIEPLIDIPEAAELIGLHPGTLAQFARDGKVPAIKIGFVWRFRPSSLARWLDELEQERRRA